MTDTPDTPAQPETAATGAAAPTAAAKVTQRVVAQYIRDMSFENGLAQKGIQGDVQPEIAIQVNLDARKRGADNQYEVITKLNIKSKSKTTGDTLFVLVCGRIPDRGRARRADAPLSADRMPAHHIPLPAQDRQRRDTRRWLSGTQP